MKNQIMVSLLAIFGLTSCSNNSDDNYEDIATYPFVEALANRGFINALSIDHHLRNGLSVHKGLLTSKPVAQAQGLAFSSAEDLLKV